MLKSPYLTLAGSTYDVTKINKTLISDAIITKEGVMTSVNVNDGIANNFIISASNTIPLFTQTMYVEYRGTEYIFADSRSYGGNHREKLLTRLYLASHSVWINDPNTLVASTTLAGRAFVNLMLQQIMNVYRITLTDSLRIRIMCAAYYANLTEVSRHTMIKLIKDYSGARTVDIEGELETMTNVETNTLAVLAQRISEINNPALKNITAASLTTIMLGVYHGLNSKENIAVGLEFLPRWVSLVAIVLQDAGYNNTRLGTIVKKISKKDDHMVTYIQYLLEG